jgi:hypothetical protein
MEIGVLSFSKIFKNVPEEESMLLFFCWLVYKRKKIFRYLAFIGIIRGDVNFY